jgi:hypothetical protein
MILNLRIWENLSTDDPLRFYPTEVPVFDYEPLRSHFQIVKSPEAINEGIISLISLKPEDIAFKWTGFFMTTQTLHSLQHKKNLYIHDTFFSGKLLHSCVPNLRLDMETLTAYVIKTIEVFDRLTIDYEDTEDVLYNHFDCRCGNKECRGYISGKLK